MPHPGLMEMHALGGFFLLQGSSSLLAFTSAEQTNIAPSMSTILLELTRNVWRCVVQRAPADTAVGEHHSGGEGESLQDHRRVTEHTPGQSFMLNLPPSLVMLILFPHHTMCANCTVCLIMPPSSL